MRSTWRMPRDVTQLNHKQCGHDSDQNNATDCKRQLEVDEGIGSWEDARQDGEDCQAFRKQGVGEAWWG